MSNTTNATPIPIAIFAPFDRLFPFKPREAIDFKMSNDCLIPRQRPLKKLPNVSPFSLIDFECASKFSRQRCLSRLRIWEFFTLAWFSASKQSWRLFNSFSTLSSLRRTRRQWRKKWLWSVFSYLKLRCCTSSNSVKIPNAESGLKRMKSEREER